jgi:antitoxin HigA-1
MPTTSSTTSRIERTRPPTHPGTIAWDALNYMPVEAAADLLGVHPEQLEPVFGGAAPVTPELALRLGRLLGNGPDLWVALQLDFDRARMGSELERISEPA